LHVGALVFEFLQQQFEHFFELIRIPVEGGGFCDDDGLEGVDDFLAQLALGRSQPDFGINSKYFVDGVECFDVGEDTKV